MLTLQLPHINMHTKKICGKLDKNQFFHHFFQNFKYSYSRFQTIYLYFIHGRYIIAAHSKLSYSCLLCQNAVPSFDFLREVPIIKCTLKGVLRLHFSRRKNNIENSDFVDRSCEFWAT